MVRQTEGISRLVELLGGKGADEKSADPPNGLNASVLQVLAPELQVKLVEMDCEVRRRDSRTRAVNSWTRLVYALAALVAVMTSAYLGTRLVQKSDPQLEEGNQPKLARPAKEANKKPNTARAENM